MNKSQEDNYGKQISELPKSSRKATEEEIKTLQKLFAKQKTVETIKEIENKEHPNPNPEVPIKKVETKTVDISTQNDCKRSNWDTARLVLVAWAFYLLFANPFALYLLSKLVGNNWLAFFIASVIFFAIVWIVFLWL